MATMKDYMEQLAQLPDKESLEAAIVSGGISEMYATHIRDMWKKHQEEGVFYEEDHYGGDPYYAEPVVSNDSEEVEEAEEKKAIRKIVTNFPYKK